MKEVYHLLILGEVIGLIIAIPGAFLLSWYIDWAVLPGFHDAQAIADLQKIQAGVLWILPLTFSIFTFPLMALTFKDEVMAYKPESSE